MSLERRVGDLERKQGGPQLVEFWTYDRDNPDLMRGPDGQTCSRAEFERRNPTVQTVTFNIKRTETWLDLQPDEEGT